MGATESPTEKGVKLPIDPNQIVFDSFQLLIEDRIRLFTSNKVLKTENEQELTELCKDEKTRNGRKGTSRTKVKTKTTLNCPLF